MRPPLKSEWTIEERVKAQEEILGVGVDAHPLELVADKLIAAGAVSTLEAAGHGGSDACSVAGLRQTSHRSRTARGEVMMFMTLEDLEGLLDVVFFPDVYRRVSNCCLAGSPFWSPARWRWTRSAVSPCCGRNGWSA